MSIHIFHVGDKVLLRPHFASRTAASNVYTVKAQLPPLGDQHQYRVRCDSESYERVAVEDQLSPVTDNPSASDLFAGFAPR
jgi:hypothetical protein